MTGSWTPVFDVLVTLFLLGLGIVWLVRFVIRNWNRRSWPVISATVERATVSRKKWVSFYALFEYSFTVEGNRFRGRFALIGQNRAHAQQLQEQWLGKQIPVRYNPKIPQVSYLVDEQLGGRFVLQSREWVGHFQDFWPQLPQ